MYELMTQESNKRVFTWIKELENPIRRCVVGLMR